MPEKTSSAGLPTVAVPSPRVTTVTDQQQVVGKAEGGVHARGRRLHHATEGRADPQLASGVGGPDG